MLPFVLSILLSRGEVGLASTYARPSVDRYNTGGLACRAEIVRRMGAGAWRRMLPRGVAHRTLPCGAELLVYDVRTQRHSTLYVIDRGPYGQLCGRVWKWAAVLGDGCRWRGVLDLYEGATRRLQAQGMDAVWVVPALPLPRVRAVPRS